ncbi:APC family permease [Leucobacter sp. GX24907]
MTASHPLPPGDRTGILTVQASSGRNQDNLKRTIGLPGAIGIAVNQIIGGGIVSLTGVAIAMTGGGVALSYVIAVIAVIISAIPYASLAAAMPAAGGTYAWPARVIHPAAGFGLAWVLALGKTALSLYGLSAGAYLHAINPWFNPVWVAVALVTIFFIANLAGAVVSARFGVVLMVIMLVGFATFAFYGLAMVDWQLYPEVMPNGLVELLSAAALLSFATSGAYGVGELGREMKRPGRDIPIAMIGGTAIVGVIYVLVALPAAGVLPISEVAGEPLSTVAAEFLPRGLWIFFILGGALVAIVSTMNAELLWGTKALLAASDDGWLPKWLGAVNKRFGTPHWLLTILYFIGIIPAIAGVDIDVIGTASSVFVQLMFVVVVIASVVLRYKLPEVHAASPFKLPKGLHFTIAGVAILMSIYQGYLLIVDFDIRVWSAVGIWMLLGLIIGVSRYPKVKRILAARRAEAEALSER